MKLSKEGRISEWYTSRGLEPRNYQIDIVGLKINNVFEFSDECVLAACPSAGKTLMSICWIDQYLIENPSHRVLVLTHGTTVLRDQYESSIKKYHPDLTVSTNKV